MANNRLSICEITPVSTNGEEGASIIASPCLSNSLHVQGDYATPHFVAD